MPLRRGRQRAAPRPSGSGPASSGTATCPAAEPDSATATACTARGSRTQGMRCNPAKLLLDPYAKAIDGRCRAGTRRCSATSSTSATGGERRDSAPFMPQCVVVDPYFDWGDDRPPRMPWHETVVYEVHVKGFTQRHPDVPEELRGTYAGLAHPAAIEHLQPLGVTAVELLPVHQFVHDQRLRRRGAAQLLGLQLDRLLRPAQRLLGRGQARRAGAGVQGDGAGAARRRHRGHPRRGLQPHRRGQPPRPTLSLQGHRQRRLLPRSTPTSRATTWTTPAPATR